MQAVILIGGLGTRLRDLYPDRPKALVPMLGKPYLDWLLGWLSRQGVTDCHLACGYRADAVGQWLAKRQDKRVTMSTEPEPLGTAGGLKFVEPFVRGETVLVLNGDSFLPSLNVSDLVKAHDDLITIAVTRIEAAGRYGTVELDDHRRVTAFREKAEHASGWVNGGVYLLNREVFGDIPAQRRVSLEQETFPAVAARGRMHAFPTLPPLLDMGTPDGLRDTEAYLAAHGEFARGDQ